MDSRRSLNNIHVLLRLESQWIYYFLQDPEEVCYDLKYALRLCSEHNKQKACVHIYSTMGLFEEAVDLSLKVPPPVIIWVFTSVTFPHFNRNSRLTKQALDYQWPLLLPFVGCGNV